jgi:pSer/pThr/pTyr-binding forkhead associated (FHA) protein
VPLPTEIVARDLEKDLEFKMLLGNALFSENASLVIQFADPETRLTLTPTRETFFGRFEAGKAEAYQVDLSPFNAREKGVSRLHAVVYRARHTLSLADLGSSNGTFLNGEKLLPQQSRVLRDGDEVRFGELAALVFFR